MIFLKAIWHTTKVLGGGLYWLLSALLLWSGLAQMASDPFWGWACLAVVVLVSGGRVVVSGKRIPKDASYVVATALYLAFLVLAWGLSRNHRSNYDDLPACMTSAGQPCIAPSQSS